MKQLDRLDEMDRKILQALHEQSLIECSKLANNFLLKNA